MLLTPNILTASMLSHSFSDNWVLSIVLGVVTYFFLNLIPHWDPQNFDKPIVKIARYLDFSMTSAYVLFMIFVLFQKDQSFTFSLNSLDVNFNLQSVLGAFANLFVYLAFYFLDTNKNKVWQFFVKIDKKFRYIDRSLWGIFVQFALTILSFTILFRLIDFPSWNKVLIQLLK